MSSILYFYKGNKGDLITKIFRKVCFLDKNNSLSNKVQEGDYWECVIKKEFEKFNIITPIKKINYNDQWEFSTISDNLEITLENSLDSKRIHFTQYNIPKDVSKRILSQINIKIKERREELEKRKIKSFFDKISESNKKIQKYRIDKLAFKKLKGMKASFPEIIDASPSHDHIQYEKKDLYLTEESAFEFDNNLLKKEKGDSCIDFRIAETLVFVNPLIEMIRKYDYRINPPEHIIEKYQAYKPQTIIISFDNFSLKIIFKPILINIIISDEDWGLHKANPTQYSYRITWDLAEFHLEHTLEYNSYILMRINEYYEYVKKKLKNEFIERDYVHIVSNEKGVE